MKIQWNKQYTTIAIYAFIVLAAAILFALGLYHISEILDFAMLVLSKLSPIIFGAALAYLLNPLLVFFEKKVFQKIPKLKSRTKLLRGLSVFSVIAFVAVVISLLIIIIIPQIAESYKTLTSTYDSVDDVITSIINYFKTNEFFANNYEQILSFLGIDMTTGDSAIIEKLYNIAKEYSPLIIAAIKDVALGIYDTVVAFILSIYLLAFKEKLIAICKKLFASSMKKSSNEKLFHIFSIFDHNFGMYIRGRLVDAFIVFVICYIVYGFMGLNYYPLLALITGVTNIIPVFGPFIGAVPVAAIVLFTQPAKVIWVLLVILIIQLLDGNFIGPMVLGDSVGLSSIWIISSTILFGELFGFFGMLLGVPIFASLYAIIREKANEKLEKKDMPTDLNIYYPTEKRAIPRKEPSMGQKIKKFMKDKFQKLKSKIKNKKSSKED